MGFDTSLFDEAIAAQKRQREQLRKSVLQDVLLQLAELTPPQITRVYIFGSLVQPGRFDEQSDVDIAVEALAPEPFFAFAAGLSTALQRDVDLVELRKCHFADVIRREGLLWIASH